MSRASQRKLAKGARSIHCYPRLLATDVRRSIEDKVDRYYSKLIKIYYGSTHLQPPLDGGLGS